MPILRKEDGVPKPEGTPDGGYAALAEYLITGKATMARDEDHNAIVRAAARMAPVMTPALEKMMQGEGQYPMPMTGADGLPLPPTIVARIEAGATVLQNDADALILDETGIAPDPNEAKTAMPKTGSLTERTTADMLAEASMVPKASRDFQMAKQQVRYLREKLEAKRRHWADAMDAKTKMFRAGEVANARQDLRDAEEERRLCYWRLMGAQGLDVPPGALDRGGAGMSETEEDNLTEDETMAKKNGKKSVTKKTSSKATTRTTAPKRERTVQATPPTRASVPPPPQEAGESTLQTVPSGTAPEPKRTITSVTREVCGDGLPHTMKDIVAAVVAAFPEKDPNKVAMSVGAYIRPKEWNFWLCESRGVYRLDLGLYAAHKAAK